MHKLITITACILLWVVVSFAQLQYPQRSHPGKFSESVRESPPIYDTNYVVVQPGWNLVSVPGNVFDWRKEVVFPTAVSKAFAYVDGYVAKDTLEYGRGYWIKFAAAETIVTVGCHCRPVTPEVRGRWNIVGASNRNIAIDTVTTIPSGLRSTAFFRYDATLGYVEVDTLRLGQGYWVKMDGAGLLNVPWRYVEDPFFEPFPHFFEFPAWHPLGEWIAAVHAESIDTNGDDVLDYLYDGIWIVDANDGRRQPLIERAYNPAWSPDGSTLALVYGGQIFTVRVTNLDPARYDTLSIQQLTSQGNNFSPAWSPYGGWIAFDSNNDTPNGMYFIWKMKSDGTSKQRIGYEPGIGEVRMPKWSPDNDQIVHQRYLGVTYPEIAMMDTNGSNVTRLTYDLNDDKYPGFSSTGNHILYISRCFTDGSVSIWRMNADGSSPFRISPRSSWYVFYDISPDGSKIVMVRDDWCGPIPGSGELYIVNIDGTGLHRLTFFHD